MTPLHALLRTIQRLHTNTPALHGFTPWPEDLTPTKLGPAPCAAAATVTNAAMPGTRATSPVIRALRRAAPNLHWKQTYSEAEVGARFLATYGYVELFGPNGHFHSAEVRGYVGYWGPDLIYDWHAHEAEELYFTLSGRAMFCARGASNALLRPGEARQHLTEQPHFMATLDRPYLAYAVWRGAGIDGLPRMIAA